MNAPISNKVAKGSLPWFRVEFDDSGHLVACDPAEGSVGASGWVVVYVQAKDEDGAKAAAARMRQRLMLRDRRKRYGEQGLCPYCGRERTDKSLKKCLVCAERGREWNRRRDARKRDDVPHQSPGPRQVERRQTLQQVERLSVLLEVRAVWQRAHNTKYFTEWLNSAVEAAKKGAEQC